MAVFSAEDGIRTRDPQLGKLMLCQLSYFRLAIFGVKPACCNWGIMIT